MNQPPYQGPPGQQFVQQPQQQFVQQPQQQFVQQPMQQQQFVQQPQQQQFVQQPQQFAQQPQQGGGPSIFDGMRTATIFKQGNYYQPGIYDVEVIRCLDKQTFKGKMGFIVELRTIASNNPAEPVGGEKSWFQDMSSYPQTAWSACLEFAIAVYGIPQSDSTKIAELQQGIVDIMKRAVSPENFLAGRKIRLETFMKKTKGKGGDFTVHRWTPYDGTPVPAMSAAHQMQQTPMQTMQQVPLMPPMQQQQPQMQQQPTGQFGAPLPMSGQPQMQMQMQPQPQQFVQQPMQQQQQQQQFVQQGAPQGGGQPPPMEYNEQTKTWQFKK